MDPGRQTRTFYIYLPPRIRYGNSTSLFSNRDGKSGLFFSVCSSSWFACLGPQQFLADLMGGKASVQSQAWQILAEGGLTRVHLAQLMPAGDGGVGGVADLA